MHGQNEITQIVTMQNMFVNTDANCIQFENKLPLSTQATVEFSTYLTLKMIFCPAQIKGIFLFKKL